MILRINGEVEARTTVRVPAGNTEAVSFEVSRTEPGDYAVEIEAEDAVDVKVLTGSFTVLEEPPPPPPPLSSEGLTVEPTEVESGGSVTISVTAVNDGADAITETVTLRVDGRLIEEKGVTVAGGATQTVSFTHVEEAVGAHSVSVEGLTATFTVTAVEEDGGGGAIIIILIVVIIAVLAIGGGAFFYFRRRGEA